MKSIFLWSFISVLFGTSLSHAEGKIGTHIHLANCIGEVEGFTPEQKLLAEFDFYQEYHSDGDSPTGYGFATQKVSGPGGEMKFVLPLEIIKSGETLQITAFAALNPTQQVSQFQLPKLSKFTLDIPLMGQSLGTFQCNSLYLELM